MLWIKSLHVIAVETWFAAIFYLPRLFVYHAMADDEISIARFKTMERKLYRGIMTPSAIATAIFGGWLLIDTWPAFASMGWLWVKLALVVALYGYHGYCGRLVRVFANDENVRTDKFFRWFNEAPVLALIVITIMVIVKPF